MPYSSALRLRARSVRLCGEYSIYAPGDAVGKACEQVGRNASGELVASSADVYEKWAQALSSAHDLTYLSCGDGSERSSGFAMSLVMPIVVVPNGRLWLALYDHDGQLQRGPEQVDRCAYYVGRAYEHQSIGGGEEVTLSHLEFVTVDGLLTLVRDLCDTENEVVRTFPVDRVSECLQNQQAT